MRLVAEMEVPGILASAPNPEKGLTIDEISRETGVNAVKFEGILRLLVSQGWFRESQPGYFANSRLTNLVKKGSKTYFLPTYMNNLIHQVSASLPDMINHSDPEFRHSTDHSKTAFQLQFKTELPFLGVNSWLANNPSDAYGFGQSMGAVGLTSDPGILADFPWEATAEGKDAIIDVGGGQGTLCCSLAAKFPHIQAAFIVQDLPETRDVAERFIQSQGQSHRVKFQAHDFFEPQQRKGKNVFVIQRVLHDWTTEKAAQIIGNIRDVLDEDSCLLIIESIIQPSYASPTGPSFRDSLQHLGNKFTSIPPPPFIPVDFGDSSRIQHQVNLCVRVFCNSCERTLPQFEEMIKVADMKIKKIHGTRSWESITEVITT
ncbi:hypothetical protein HGRIS_007543 [Hohenbuehelia grisea]